MDINSFVIGYKKGKASGGGGAELNIAYGDTAPEDTSKLWVKTSEPNGVIIEADSVIGGGKRPASITRSPAHWSPALTQGGVVLANDKVYWFGGINSSGTKYNIIKKFDPNTQLLDDVSTTLPAKTSKMGVGAVGSNIFLFNGDTGSITDKIYKFDTITEEITDITSTAVGNGYKLHSVACATIGKWIYCFGGVQSSGFGTNFVSRFDGEEGRFYPSNAYLPQNSNSGYLCASVGTNVYVFNCSNREIYCYDSETEIVTTMSDIMPKTFFGGGCCAIGDKVYIFGGMDRNKTICCYDTVKQKIYDVGVEMTESLYGCRGVLAGEEIFIFGDSSKIQRFMDAVTEVPLDNGNLKIFGAVGANTCQIINTDTLKASIGVKEVYKGNANNEGEQVEAALYKDGAWTTI